MNMQKQPLLESPGFTLIELMVIIAILGILIAIIVPSYQNRIRKVKFNEVISATAPYKLAVENCAHRTGTLMLCGNGFNGVPAAPAPSGHLASLTTSTTGVITATSQNITVRGISTFTYILTPTITDSHAVTWKVSGTCISNRLC